MTTKPKRPMSAIRRLCYGCQGGSWRRVRECLATDCPLHEFRLGKNPYHKLAGMKPKTSKESKKK